MARAALEDEDEAEPIQFVGSMSVSDGEPAVLAALRSTLDTQVSEFYARSNPDSAFDLLREKVEDKGVFVLLRGDLGSYHTAIDAEAFRGFVIADEVAPFIVINDNDARPAWSFTLLHELTHLILGQSGMSAGLSESDIERFCDSVAGEFLLPREELRLLEISDAPCSGSILERRVSEFARDRNLSRRMVAYRAHRAGLIAGEAYHRLDGLFRGQWSVERDRRRQRNRGSGGGPNYYVIRRHRVGRALTGFVRRMLESGGLSTTKAAKILGVKPTQVGRMLEL